MRHTEKNLKFESGGGRSCGATSLLTSVIRLCRSLAIPFLIFVAICTPGCSSSDGRSGVEGKVTYDGQPLAIATITFIPTAVGGISCGGVIEKGQYKVEPKFGPMVGPHRVEIRWAKPTGKKSKNEFGEEIEKREEGLPDKYHANSTLSAEIKSGTNKLDFSLEK